MLERLKTAGALIVVLKEETLEVRLRKYARNGFVIASCVEFALVVATTDMDRERYVGMPIDNGIVHLDTHVDELIGIAATLDIAFTHAWIK